MTITETYAVTDIYPSPKRVQWLTRGRVGRFVKADLMALWMVAWFCTRHLGRVLAVRTDSGMPVWFHIFRVLLIGWMAIGLLHLAIENPDAFNCPQASSPTNPSHC